MTTPATHAELVCAYWRSGLPRIGMTFKFAMSLPTVAWSLEKSAISHRTAPAPIQAPLFEDAHA